MKYLFIEGMCFLAVQSYVVGIDGDGGIYIPRDSKRRLVPKPNASLSENAAEGHTSRRQYPRRRSLPYDAADIAQDDCWTEDDRQGRRTESITTSVPRQNAASAAEDDTSPVRRRGRRSLSKAADMQPPDNHRVEGDKPILNNSHSRLDDDVFVDIETHGGLKSDVDAGCDSKSPAMAALAGPEDDVAAVAAVADMSCASMDGEPVHVSMMACYCACNITLCFVSTINVW